MHGVLVPLGLVGLVGVGACGSSRSPSPAWERAAAGASASAASPSTAATELPPYSTAHHCAPTYGGGFLGGHPVWTVEARFLADTARQLLLFGDVDAPARLVRPAILVDAKIEDVKAVRGRPGPIAVPATGETQLIYAAGAPPLPDAGVLSVADDGALLAIRTPTAIAVYEAGTWKRRFSTPVENAGPQADFLGDRYVGCVRWQWDKPNVVVIDVETGAFVAEEVGFASVSPAHRMLAVMSVSDDKPGALRLVTLGAPKATTRELPVDGVGSLVFDGETHVDLVEFKGYHDEQAVLWRVDVGTGRVVPGPKFRVLDGGTRRAIDELESTARSLLPRDRIFSPRTGRGQRTFVGPTRSGFVAAVTMPANSTATTSAPGLFIANTNSRSVLHTVPLPATFQLTGLVATRDERFVIACAVDSAFFVDVTTGRTALRSGVLECAHPTDPTIAMIDGSLVWTPTGLLDLESDESDPAWPALLGMDLRECSALPLPPR